MATVVTRDTASERVDTAPAATATEDIAATTEKKPSAPRLAALDAFRGLTIFLMLLVNNIALDSATPDGLKHGEWSGQVHIADIVFPWFLLATGIAVPFAVASHRKRGSSWLGYYGKALKRTASLIALGILVDSVIAHHFAPGLGVLQIIGLAYFVAALLSPLAARWRILAAAALLAGHTYLLLTWHVAGISPGRITETANAVDFFNEVYLVSWNLKGLISVIPTAAMVLIGSVVGDIFRNKEWSLIRHAGVAALVGGLCTGLGVIMGDVLPMNKPLWTGSYILFTAGIGITLIAVLHLLIDSTKDGQKGAFPLVVFGSNAITAYVLPIVVKITVLQNTAIGRFLHLSREHPTIESVLQGASFHTFGRLNGGWVYTFGYLAAVWAILYILYRKQWFLRV